MQKPVKTGKYTEKNNLRNNFSLSIFFSLFFEKIHDTNKQQKMLVLLNRANDQFRYKRKISKHSKATTKSRIFRAQNTEK